MAIVTLTVNPALDKSTSVEQLVHTQKMYSDTPLFSPGGGGINVSRVLKRLGTEALTIMQASGPNGMHLKELLKQEGVDISCFETKGWTRENFVVNEQSSELQYRFSMPGPTITREEEKTIISLVEKHTAKNDFLVLSGSLPPSLPADFYKKICHWAKVNGVKVVLDTKGQALKQALSEGVYLVKPNLGELAQLNNKEWITRKEAEEMARQMIEQKQANIVVVSLGEAGAFLLSHEGLVSIASPKVEVKSAVGAGDSMVAGVVYALEKKMSQKEALKYGVACGTATVLSEGTNLCAAKDVHDIYCELIEK